MSCKEVPCVGDQSARSKLRIAHISDTHNAHRSYTAAIMSLGPFDVLVHSGDLFGYYNKPEENEWLLDDLNAWYAELPARYVVQIAGNHDMAFVGLTPEQIQRRLSHCIYLQDSSVTIEGCKFYGSPWTAHGRMFCGVDSATREQQWNLIPGDTDVLITHMPPFAILDLANDCGSPGTYSCESCGVPHFTYQEHWGDQALRETVLERVKPKLHMFGHVHQGSGYDKRGSTVFVNSGMSQHGEVHVVDLCYEPGKADTRVPGGCYSRKCEHVLRIERPAGGWPAVPCRRLARTGCVLARRENISFEDAFRTATTAMTDVRADNCAGVAAVLAPMADSAAALSGLARLVVEEAVDRPAEARTYARLTVELEDRCPHFPDGADGRFRFGPLLLEALRVHVGRSARLSSERSAGMRRDEAPSFERHLRRRNLGALKLMGELFLLDRVTGATVDRALLVLVDLCSTLVDQRKKGSASSSYPLTLLCELLDTAGPGLAKRKDSMGAYTTALQRFATEPLLSAGTRERVSCALEKLVELSSYAGT